MSDNGSRRAGFLPARFVTLLLCVAAQMTGCSKEAPPPAVQPAADVTVMTITPSDVPAVFEFPGQTQSSREVEIRARVDGFLERRVYTEGALVKAGQTLFLMDRKPFEATLQQARGALAQQQAKLKVAEANLARVKPLADQNAVSKKDLDDAIGNEQSARAAVISAEGSVREAEINLSYTTITSPLAGLASFAKIQDGAYVSATNNLLTTVAQLNPMWVNFSISENEHLRFRESVSKGQLRPPPGKEMEIQVVLGDGSVFENRGRISFADPSFSKETGTFLVRATFSNPRGILRPGQFVRVQVLGITRPDAIIVPQRAVHQGAKSHYVWVVGKDGKAEQRAVGAGEWSGDDWIINMGLRAGEQVVVDGGIRVAPGVPLKISAYTQPEPTVTPQRRSADPTSVEGAPSPVTRKPPPVPPGPEAPPASGKGPAERR